MLLKKQQPHLIIAVVVVIIVYSEGVGKSEKSRIPLLTHDYRLPG